MNEKVKELLEELKDGAENPTVIYPTFDGSDEEKFENDKLLTPESCKLLFNYITQLETNWDELKEYIEKQIIDSKTTSSENYYFKTIYKYMLELEGKSE